MQKDLGFSYFLDVVRGVSNETQAVLSEAVGFLEEIDRLYVDWIPAAGSIKPSSCSVLILNAHSSLRAALCLSLSGQL